jgi:hypothetical protein
VTTPGRGSDVPFSIEPVRGWRVWRLRRLDGVLMLGSVMRPGTWPPKHAMEATCPWHPDEPLPGRGCTCGVYGASSPEDLSAMGVFHPGTGVLGSIAMWGRVVDHARGARSRFAYPERLALVCGRCLTSGAGAVEAVIVVHSGTDLFPVCRGHRRAIRGTSWPAADIRSELLQTYAVESLPLGSIAEGLRPLDLMEMTPSGPRSLWLLAKVTSIWVQFLLYAFLLILSVLWVVVLTTVLIRGILHVFR